MPILPLPGDVLVTRDRRLYARLIRFGAALRDQPDSWNHCIIYSGLDTQGTPWGIEARPGGVGKVDLTPWLADRWTMSNAEQPKTDAQRGLIVELALATLGIQYDWFAIAVDAFTAITLQPSSSRLDGLGNKPRRLVCSSLASWLYHQADVAQPVEVQHLRTATPADWATWILERNWS